MTFTKCELYLGDAPNNCLNTSSKIWCRASVRCWTLGYWKEKIQNLRNSVFILGFPREFMWSKGGAMICSLWPFHMRPINPNINKPFAGAGCDTRSIFMQNSTVKKILRDNICNIKEFEGVKFVRRNFRERENKIDMKKITLKLSLVFNWVMFLKSFSVQYWTESSSGKFRSFLVFCFVEIFQSSFNFESSLRFFSAELSVEFYFSCLTW